jgi:hypothetical protein
MYILPVSFCIIYYSIIVSAAMFCKFQQQVFCVFLYDIKGTSAFFCFCGHHLQVLLCNAVSVLPYLHIYQSQDSDEAVDWMSEES